MVDWYLFQHKIVPGRVRRKKGSVHGAKAFYYRENQKGDHAGKENSKPSDEYRFREFYCAGFEPDE